MRVLICGSRGWVNDEPIDMVLSSSLRHCQVTNQILTVIHGACNTELDTRHNRELGIGADALAHAWCQMVFTVQEGGIVNEWAYPADWSKFGKRAGFVRNAQMLEEGEPNLVYGFTNDPPSPGTKMMLDLAKKAGIPTYRIQEW